MAKKTSTRSKLPTIERKIMFYRAIAELDGSGEPIEFDPLPSLRHINTLGWDEERYCASGDGRMSAVWVDHCSDNARLRIATVRRSGLPAVERAGRLSPLRISADSGIAEQTHVVFFPDNIVGVEFNFYGPRASRLASYLVTKAHCECPELVLEVLLRQDVTERLRRLQDIRLLDLKVRSPFIDTIEQANEDLGSAFRAASRAGNPDEVQLVLRPKSRSQNTLKQSLMTAVRKLAGSSHLHTDVTRFVVKGLDRDTETVEAIDLLSDDLIVKKQIVLEDARFRSVDSDSAYQAIEQAYEELRPQLLLAAGVTL